MPKKLTPEVVAEIQRVYFDEQLSSQKVAEKLHVRHKSVLKYIHRDGRPLRKAGWPEGKRQLARLGKSLPYLAPTEHPTLLDIAWAAGIVEGEGCVTKQKYGVGVRVSQKELWLLHRLRALFGGKLGTQKQHYSNTFSGGGTIGTWDMQGPRARGFLMTIYKFLSPHRQRQIREAFIMSGVIQRAA